MARSECIAPPAKHVRPPARIDYVAPAAVRPTRPSRHRTVISRTGMWRHVLVRHQYGTRDFTMA